MTTITGKVDVYLSPYSELVVDEINEQTPLKKMHLTSFAPDGYTLIGEAAVSVTVFPREVVVKHKVESLRAELQQVRAAAQLKANEIEGEIQKYLAIEHEVAA